MEPGEFLRKGDEVGQYDEMCNINLQLHSPGLFKIRVADFMNFALPRLQLQLALIFCVTQLLHILFKRFNFPRNFSEILAGIIIGRTVLGHILGTSAYRKLFPEEDVLLELLMKFGFMFFMFLVGVKMDPSLVPKAGRKGLTVGVVGALGPLFLSTYMGSDKVLQTYLPAYRRPAVRGISRVISTIPFPVVAALLVDLKIMNTELGRLSLSAALISDIVNVVSNVLSGAYTTYNQGFGVITSVITLIENCMVTFGAISTRLLFIKIIKLTPEGKPVKSIYISLVCGVVLVGAIACDNVGLQYHFAPFLIGLVVPAGPPLGSAIADKLDTFISGFLAPLILTYSAIKIDLATFYDFSFLGTIITTLLAIMGIKFACVSGTALCNKVTIRDAVILGIIMGSQGTVQGALYDIVYKIQTIDDESFSLVILSILVVALLSHLGVQFLYDYSRTYTGYQKRNILHTPYNAELRVLACADRLDDAISTIRLLEVSNPSKESPLVIYALHLVELIGRATPLMINHGLGQKNASSTGNRSQRIIDLFQNFGENHDGVLSVQVFTAISLHKFMHHDICSLAFDKLASLIILPFHRKWNPQGKVIFDSSVQRMINQQVLESAPCSVAILIDRRKIRHKETPMEQDDTLYHVAVIFIGGSDDREALAYAKRIMMKSIGVRLTVIRIVAAEGGQENQWDTILDTETLRDIKMQGSHQSNIAYKEERSKDGPDTAILINEMMENCDFDLIMVGRRQSDNTPLLAGITEWSELPELGSIGDILASSDAVKPVSVLVVQQQTMIGKRRGLGGG